MSSTLSNRLQVLIDDDRLERVSESAKLQGLSVGEFVRRALDEALAARSRGSRQRGFLEQLKATEPIDFGSIEDIRSEIAESHIPPMYREPR